ncbi:MAG: DUF4013 domain-containing protein [Candidatus Woesearchaeota archaeon]
MVDFIKAVKLPFTDWKTLAIGAGITAVVNIAVFAVAFVLLLFAVIFPTIVVWAVLACIFIAANYVISFVITGYVVRITSNAMHNQNSTLPKWDNWKGLFEDGFKVSAIYLAYYAVPVALIIAGAIHIVMRAYPRAYNWLVFMDPRFIAMNVTTTSAALIVAGVFLLVFLSYFAYMAMLSYSSRRRLSDAFNLKEVIGKSMRGNYFLGFLFLFAYAIGLNILGAAVSTALSVLGMAFVSFIITYFVSMVTLITITDVMGQVYAEK